MREKGVGDSEGGVMGTQGKEKGDSEGGVMGTGERKTVTVRR